MYHVVRNVVHIQDYREAREAFAQCKNERKQKDLELKNLKDRLKPYEDEKRQKEKAVEECRSRVVSLRKRQTSLAHQVAQHRRKLQELEDQVDQPRQELKEKEKEEEQRLKRLEDLRKEIDGLERELSGLDDEIAQSQSEGSDGPNARLKEIYLNLLELKSSTEKHHEAMAQLEFERDSKQPDSSLGILHAHDASTFMFFSTRSSCSTEAQEGRGRQASPVPAAKEQRHL